MATHALGRVRQDRIFYTAMGCAVAVTVFAGFARTYYLAHWFAPPPRMPAMTPLLHLHAFCFTLWILLGVAQPALVAKGRPDLHRRLGWLAAATAIAVWALGNIVSAQSMKIGYRALGDPYAFYTVTFFSMQAFGLIVLLAILKRKDAQTHKRLMLLSSAAILEAAFGRIPLHLIELTAPLSFYVGSELIILAGIVYDRATRGRVHPVWTWGGGALVASQLLRIAIMHTPAWLAFAHGVSALAGPN
ncbi:MAG TPA: hypothetical protein VJR87_07800 [Allosphingosinicella sp.]|nr:hypothetical protein [Allosphingosinicella sp.]